MQSAETIAECQACLTASDLDKASKLARTLETEYPQSEDEWRLLYNIFIQLKDLSWAEIMTARFLEQNPDNISALIEQADVISNRPAQRAKELSEKLSHIESLGPKTSEEHLKIAVIYQKFGQGQIAASYFSVAERLDPDNTDIVILGTRNLIDISRLQEARDIIRRLYLVHKNNPKILILLMNFGARIEDHETTASIIEQLVQLIGDDNHMRVSIATRAANIKRDDILLRIWHETDLKKIHQTASLAAFQQAIAGRGLIEIERSIMERILALDPANGEFLAINSSIQQQFISKFYQISSQPAGPTSARGAQSACLGLLRRLMLRRKWPSVHKR